MGQLEKTSTLQYKRCWCCRETKPTDNFYRDRSRADGHSNRCKQCSREYWQSGKGKLTRKRYSQSWKGMLSHDRCNARYYNSAKGQEWWKIYALSGRKTELARENYHRIQGEAGCHWKPRTFYPAYRLLKALAEEEIK